MIDERYFTAIISLSRPAWTVIKPDNGLTAFLSFKKPFKNWEKNCVPLKTPRNGQYHSKALYANSDHFIIFARYFRTQYHVPLTFKKCKVLYRNDIVSENYWLCTTAWVACSFRTLHLNSASFAFLYFGMRFQRWFLESHLYKLMQFGAVKSERLSAANELIPGAPFSSRVQLQ